jgi:O-antigen/teichoic acid export membrane protein
MPLIIKIVTLGLSFLVTYIASKSLSNNEFGLFAFAQLAILFIVTVSKFGFDSSIVRPVAIATKNKDILHIKNCLLTRYLITLSIFSALAFLTLQNAQLVFSDYLNHPAVVELLPHILLLSLATSLLAINSGCFKGLHSPNSSVIFNGFLSALLTIPLLFIFSYNSSNNLLLIIAISTITSCIFSFILITIKLKKIKSAPSTNHSTSDKSSLLKITKEATPLWVSSLVFLIIPQFSFFILSKYSSLDDLGIYSVALKISTSMSMILFAANSVLAPKFAILYFEKKYEDLDLLFNQSSYLLLTLAIIISILFMAASGFIMGLFGTRFEAGTIWLNILIIGQLVNIGTGSVVNLLIMTGHEKVHRNIALLTAAISIVLAIIIVPKYGALGAALTTTISMAAQNLFSLYFVKTRILNFKN